MHTRYPSAMLLAFLFFTFLAASGSTTSLLHAEGVRQQGQTRRSDIININGDVALSTDQNRITWNPHATGLTNLSQWNVSFQNETEIIIKTSAAEVGHVATGSWWTTGFKTGEKLPFFTSEPVLVMATFRFEIVEIRCEKGTEWLRIALACAIQRADSSVVYTELDVWDSPATLSNPDGNTARGGNVVYTGGDVVEYKIDQMSIGEWRDYSVNITKYIDSAWTIKSGDVLESVYIVVEVIGGVSVDAKADDLWLTKQEP